MHQAGQVIDDRYVLIRSLGIHSGAAMWEAEHRQVGRKVTIKLLASGEADPLAQDRLLAEARAATLIGHATAVEVYDVGVTDRAYYLVTEPLAGELLSDTLARQGKLSIEDTCEIAAAILEGLEAAHNAGIVHGELGTSKVMLRRESDGALSVKVLDYRAAVVHSGVEPIEPPANSAPSSDHAEPRSDVHAVASLIHLMITGSAPCAPSAGAAEPPDAEAVPRELGRILDRALGRGAEAPFTSAREMATLLVPFATAPRPVSLSPRNSQVPFMTQEARRSRGLARLERVVHALSESPPRIAAVGARPRVVVVDTDLSNEDLVSPKIPGPPRAPRHVGVESHRAARGSRKARPVEVGKAAAEPTSSLSAVVDPRERELDDDEIADDLASMISHAPASVVSMRTRWRWSLLLLAIGGVMLGLLLARLLHW